MARHFTFAGRRARVDVDRIYDGAEEAWILCVRRRGVDCLIRLPSTTDEREVTRRALVEAWGEQS